MTPQEVEEAIATPQVLESAVIGLPHPDFGEGVVAIVVPTPGVEISEADIIAGLKGQLARFKQPKRVVIVAELPRNSMGKVQKILMRDEYVGLLT